MKPFLAMLGGFALSIGMFAGGLVLATYTLTAKPPVQANSAQDVAGLWTAMPKKIDQDNQKFERVAAVPHFPDNAERDPDEPIAVASADPAAWPEFEQEPDEFVTSAMEALKRMDEDSSRDVELFVAHQEWCAQRYRSYRPKTNTFTPYRGGQRTCVSPYSGDIDASASELPDAQYVSVADASGSHTSKSDADYWVDSWHVQSCFDRYRSYRPEDNSYQPHGGGPRLQCD